MKEDVPNAKAEVKSSSSPHVVMYGASWCPWCKKQKAVLESAHGLFTHAIYWCDQKQCNETVTRVPTLVVESAGVPTARLFGFHTLSELEHEIGITS